MYFQVMAAKLWDGLGGMDPVFHLRCVSLLYQLHNLVPNPKTIERILARSLERENDGCSAGGSRGGGGGGGGGGVDAYQRFSTLWHLSRDLTSSRSAVDLCTLKMVSGLRAGRGSVRAVCARWVEQCVARGDTGRLVEPLLLALLDAATARVSVSHAGVTRAGDVYSIRCGTTKFDILRSVKNT